MSEPTKTVVMKLSKDFGSNMRGEICGFTPDTAAHIIKNNGGEKLAEISPGERYDVESKKVVAAAKK